MPITLPLRIHSLPKIMASLVMEPRVCSSDLILSKSADHSFITIPGNPIADSE
jgi:hypothetical protein